MVKIFLLRVRRFRVQNADHPAHDRVQSLAHALRAVSYTHLDVYKRQEARAPHAGEHHFIRILVDLFVYVREIQILGIRPGIIVQIRNRFRLRKTAGRGKRVARDAIGRVKGRQPFGMLIARISQNPAAVVVQDVYKRQ